MAKGLVDRGAFELVTCAGDCVNSSTINPPPDGNVDAADLGFLFGEWGTPSATPNSCADIVDSSTIQPPPDGNVDAADLGALMGNWGTPCVNQNGGENLFGSNPYENTAIGDLLDELLEEEDPEAQAAIIEALLALLNG